MADQGEIKIWFQQQHPARGFEQMVGELERFSAAAAGPSTLFAVKCLDDVAPDAPWTVDVHFQYFNLLNKKLLIEGVVEAQRQGYDGAIISCFMDPGVREIREIVDIPVVGLGEPALHLACQLGGKLALITHMRKFVGDIELSLAMHGLRDRLIATPVRHLGFGMESYDYMLNEPDRIVERFVATARECVEAGAEVLVPACGVMTMCLTKAGVTEVQGAPVINLMAAAFKTLEALVAMRRPPFFTGTSRAGLYAKPSEDEIARNRQMFGLSPEA